MPYFICPNCKERSIDSDRKEGLYDEPVSCHHCGFGFLFELIDDYYPAPGTGFVVCDKEARILAVGRGVVSVIDAEDTTHTLDALHIVSIADGVRAAKKNGK